MILAMASGGSSLTSRIANFWRFIRYFNLSYLISDGQLTEIPLDSNFLQISTPIPPVPPITTAALPSSVMFVSG